jgi:N-acetyl-gamma-glutamyl-phosphate reductase
VASGKARVGILGASGYAGALAAHLIDRHPFFELAYVTSRSDAGLSLQDLHPRTRVGLHLEEYEAELHCDVDAAVVAYPHGAAAPVVEELRDGGARVVDLSADFRLADLATYESWYGRHGAPKLFGTAVYGLPELYRERIAEAGLVANPGCYPTAALLALAPLARAGLIKDLVIDAKSGVSGAGRDATAATHFVSANENVNPYKVEGHRHTPEIEQELALLGADIPITFVPHLVPLAQGELDSCYVTPTRDADDAELQDLFREAYAQEPWVEVRLGAPGVLDVRDTNYCRLSVHWDARAHRIMVFSAIDNLWKGAASQAVQNLNVMYGRDESEGLGL